MSRKKGKGPDSPIPSKLNANSHFQPLTVVAVLLLLNTAWSMWISFANTPKIDFFTLWSVPHALSAQPLENIYSQDGQRAIASSADREARLPGASQLQQRIAAEVLRRYDNRIEVTGSPLLYSVIQWLSSGNYDQDQKRFVFLIVLCLFLALFVLFRILQFPAVMAMLLATLLSRFFEPILSDFRVGNVNEIQLLAIAFFLLFAARRNPFPAGLILGAITMFKPTTAVILALTVIWGFVDREYRMLLKIILGFAAAAAVSIPVSMMTLGDPAIWAKFLRSLPETLGKSYPLEIGNFSLSALMFGTASQAPTLVALLLLAAFASFLLATRRKNGGRDPAGTKDTHSSDMLDNAFLIGGFGCAMTLLSSPLVWWHYHVLSIPLLLYVIRGEEPEAPASATPAPAPGGSVTRMRLLAFVPLLLGTIVVEMVLAETWWEALLANVAVVLTLALAMHRIRRKRLDPRLARIT